MSKQRKTQQLKVWLEKAQKPAILELDPISGVIVSITIEKRQTDKIQGELPSFKSLFES